MLSKKEIKTIAKDRRKAEEIITILLQLAQSVENSHEYSVKKIREALEEKKPESDDGSMDF